MEGKKLVLAAVVSGALLAVGSRPALAQSQSSYRGSGAVTNVARHGDGYRRDGDGYRGGDRRGYRHDDGYRRYRRGYRSYGYAPYAYNYAYPGYDDYAYSYPRYRTRRIFIAFPFPHFVIRTIPIPIPVPRW